MQVKLNSNKEYLTIKEAAKYLRVSKDTLRRWEKRKILKPFRSPTGWRYYSKRQLDYVFIQKPDFNTPKGVISDKLESNHPLPKYEVKSSIQSESKLRKISLIFLAFFIPFNLILIAFLIFQGISH